MYVTNKNQNKMNTITRTNLVALLLNPAVSGINGNTFVGLDTITTETLTGGKSNPMQGRVQKLTVGSQVQVFQNKNSNAYANMVQRRLDKTGKEVEFELQPRTWGVRVEGTPIIEHKNEFYLEVIFLKGGESTYTLDGNPIKKELIQGLAVKKEGTQGGLEQEDKVIIRTYKIASISRITINKQTYIVTE